MSHTDRQAFSSKCHLCKRVALWQCMDCDGGLCDQCKTVHLGHRAQRDHNVVYLRPSAIGQRVRPEQTNGIANKDNNLYCVDHPKDPAKMYCSTCSLAVCDRCVAGKHRNHNVDDVSGLVDQKRKELSKIVSQSEHRLSSLNTSMKSLQSDHQQRSQEVRDLIEAVEYRGKEIKAETDKITNNMIKKLQQIDNKNLQARKKTEENFNREQAELQTFRDNYAHEYKSRGSGNAVVKIADDATEDMKSHQSSRTNPAFSRPIFMPGSRNIADLMKVFGTIDTEEEGTNATNGESRPDSGYPPSFNTSIASSFVPLMNASTIAVVNERQAWIGLSGNGKELELVTNNGHVQQRVNLDFYLYDIASTQSGELLVVAYRGYQIMKLRQDGTFALLKDTSPFQPQGICVTPENDIFVCLYKADDKEAAVVRLIETGQTKQTIQYDSNRKQLFKDPQLVRQNINEDICVIDKCSDARNTQRCNTLVVVDRGGRLAFKYTGPKNAAAKSEYDFKGIACDKLGFILLSDLFNNSVHLLDKNGQFMQFVLAPRHGLKRPLGMSIDNSGKLWLCDESGKAIKIFKYLCE